MWGVPLLLIGLLPTLVAPVTASGEETALPGRILLTSRGRFPNVLSIRADGSGLRNLTDTPRKKEGLAAFAPDGRKIAYTILGPETAFNSLFVINRNGTGRTELATELESYFQGLAWSPDSSALAFFAQDPATGEEDIFTVDVSTGAITQVTDKGLDGKNVAWSPDGATIAFADGFQIYSVPAVGGSPVRLTDDSFRFADLPQWSPDSKRISFAGQQGGRPQADLHVMNADGSNPTQLTSTPRWIEFAGLWSSDGGWLLTTRGRFTTITENVVIVRSDGSEVRRITDDDRRNHYPTWSPDGRWIAYSRRTSCGTAIYLEPRSGTGRKRITPKCKAYLVWGGTVRSRAPDVPARTRSSPEVKRSPLR